LNPKIKNIIRFSVFLGIGVFFIWIFLRQLTPEQKQDILKSLGSASYIWVIIAIPLGILSHYVRALRWKMLISAMGYKTRNHNMFFAMIIGYFANLALPRLGEVSRCTVLARYEDVPFNKSFGTVITERAFDLLVFIVLFFLNIAIQAGKISGYIDEKIYKPLQTKLHLSMGLWGTLSIVFVSLIVLAALVYFIFGKKLTTHKLFLKVKEMIMGLIEGMKSLLMVKNLWLFGFYTFSIWALYLLMAYIVFFSIPESAGLGLNAGLAVLVFGSVGFMVVQGGIGIYPAIVAETLVIYGVASVKGYALGWLIWTSQNLTIVLVGIISLLLLPILNKRKNDTTKSAAS
jgi:hypothetical protein